MVQAPTPEGQDIDKVTDKLRESSNGNFCANERQTAPKSEAAVAQRGALHWQIRPNVWSEVASLHSSGCSEICQCPCHFNHTHFTTLRWMEFWLGSWRLTCNGFPGLRGVVCLPGCKTQMSRHWRIEYRPPPWLARIWPGVHLNFTLRPQRTIDVTDRVWLCLKMSQKELLDFARSGFDYFPDQLDINGRGLLYVSFPTPVPVARAGECC